MAAAEDSVSTVIPSRSRPHLVGKAVRSALGQTLQSNEVLVVIDGPDDATVQELAQIGDPRLRVITLPESMGAPEARNVGVRESRGRWVAFLDDDDEWMPEKLQRQVEAAKGSAFSSPVVSCCLIARTAGSEFASPRRLPAPAELIGDYLFLRRFSERGEVRLQTSTLLMTKDLLIKVPWRRCVHDEWDLLLRAAAVQGVGLAFVPEPLAIWNADIGRGRLSHTSSWRATVDWLGSVRSLVGPRAQASFLLSAVSTWAYLEGDRRAFVALLLEAVRYGRPTPAEVLMHVARWALPRRLRHPVKRTDGGHR